MNAFESSKNPLFQQSGQQHAHECWKNCRPAGDRLRKRLVTWKEMWSRTNQLGQVLYGLGMKKGDRLVLAHVPQVPQTLRTTRN
jgi:acyl-CoA synthetase (AMP-forming)/AMP-acid ligase II